MAGTIMMLNRASSAYVLLRYKLILPSVSTSPSSPLDILQSLIGSHDASQKLIQNLLHVKFLLPWGSCGQSLFNDVFRDGLCMNDIAGAYIEQTAPTVTMAAEPHSRGIHKGGIWKCYEHEVMSKRPWRRNIRSTIGESRRSIVDTSHNFTRLGIS